VTWRLVYTKAAQKDALKVASAGLRDEVQALLDVLAEDPYRRSPRFEKLVGDLAGSYSRRIDIRHRLVYQVFDDEKTVKVIRIWTQYTLPAAVSKSIAARAARRFPRTRA
jgi:Txe/YoeB family toxin of toxin-antitoxin system